MFIRIAACLLAVALALGMVMRPPAFSAETPLSGEKPDFFRFYTIFDLAECLDQFKEREYFEAMYRRAFEDGQPPEKFMLGVLYHHGLGTPQDLRKARRWYEEAARSGYRFRDLGPEADRALAELAGRGVLTGNAVDAPTAEEEETLAAGPDRQLRLATRYWRGLCAPLDWEKAMEWEIRAAENGNRQALEIVIDNYANGNYAYPRDPSRVRGWLETLAGEGDSYAGTLLAGLLLEKGEDSRPDYARALELYEAGVRAGHLLARQGLLRMYREELGVKRDEEKIGSLVKSLDTGALLREARTVEAPVPVSEYAAGIHREGMERLDAGTPDYFWAALSFLDAAGLGSEDPETYYNLGWIQENGLCGNPNPYGAARSYRTGALLGHVGAMKRLAMLHEEGKGVRRSLRQAERWFAAALAAGDGGADADVRRVRKALAAGRAEEWERSPFFRKVLEDARYRASCKP